MPLPPLPLNVETAIRGFARVSQLNNAQVMRIIADALGAEQDPDIEDEDPDQVTADATVLPPDEELNPHAPTELQRLRLQMPTWRVRQLERVHNQRGFKRLTSRSRRKVLHRQAAS